MFYIFVTEAYATYTEGTGKTLGSLELPLHTGGGGGLGLGNYNQ